MKTVILKDLDGTTELPSCPSFLPTISSCIKLFPHPPFSIALSSILVFSKAQSPTAAWSHSITDTELLRVSCQHPLSPGLCSFCLLCTPIAFGREVAQQQKQALYQSFPGDLQLFRNLSGQTTLLSIFL